MTRTFHYVPLSDFIHWMAKGWTVTDGLCESHHGEWSVMMELVEDV